MSPAHLPAPARAALLAASALLAAACDGETSTSTRDRADTGAADAKADAPADARDAAPDARDATADARDAAPPADAQPCEASAECQPETDAEADPCSVHECEGGRCVVRPPSTRTACMATFSGGQHRLGFCDTNVPFCNPCWGPFFWSPPQTCHDNPDCCWAAHEEASGVQVRCFGSCVDDMCEQPDGGCQYF